MSTEQIISRTNVVLNTGVDDVMEFVALRDAPSGKTTIRWRFLRAGWSGRMDRARLAEFCKEIEAGLDPV